MGIENPKAPKTRGASEIPRLRLGMTLRSMVPPGPHCHSEQSDESRSPTFILSRAKNLMATGPAKAAPLTSF